MPDNVDSAIAMINRDGGFLPNTSVTRSDNQITLTPTRLEQRTSFDESDRETPVTARVPDGQPLTLSATEFRQAFDRLDALTQRLMTAHLDRGTASYLLENSTSADAGVRQNLAFYSLSELERTAQILNRPPATRVGIETIRVEGNIVDTQPPQPAICMNWQNNSENVFSPQEFAKLLGALNPASRSEILSHCQPQVLSATLPHCQGALHDTVKTQLVQTQAAMAAAAAIGNGMLGGVAVAVQNAGANGRLPGVQAEIPRNALIPGGRDGPP